MTLRQRIGVVNSAYVSRPAVLVSLVCGVGRWRLGIEVCHWGIRVLLITHHVCLHIKE